MKIFVLLMVLSMVGCDHGTETGGDTVVARHVIDPFCILVGVAANQEEVTLDWGKIDPVTVTANLLGGEPLPKPEIFAIVPQATASARLFCRAYVLTEGQTEGETFEAPLGEGEYGQMVAITQSAWYDTLVFLVAQGVVKVKMLFLRLLLLMEAMYEKLTKGNWDDGHGACPVVRVDSLARPALQI